MSNLSNNVYKVDESKNSNFFYVESWKGFDLSHIDFNVKSTYRCPICEDNGEDRSGNNLNVFGLDENGLPLGAHCFKDNHFTIPSYVEIRDNRSSGKKMNDVNKTSNTLKNRVKKLPSKVVDKIISQEKIDNLISETLDHLPVKYRGLNKYNDVIRDLGIRFKLSDANEVEKMYTPVYYFDGNSRKVTGYRVRVVSNKDFYISGYCGNEVNELIGKSYNPKVADTLIVVGGEIDLVTVRGAMNDLTSKYKSHSINVVSCINGESSTADSLKNDYDWVVSHKKIILALDNDDAGWSAINACLDVLPTEQCYVANWSDYKDPNDYKNETQQLCQDIYWSVRPVDDFGYVGADELFDEGMKILQQEKIPLPVFLKDLAQFFTDGEIGLGEWINIIAATSAGKSTIIDAWKDAWIDISPYKQAVNSFEASAGRYGLKEVSLMVGKNISQISGKENRIQYYQEQKQKYLDRVIGVDGTPKFYFISKIPKSIEQFKKMLLRLVKVEGVKVLWIDPALSLKALCQSLKEFDDLLVWIDQNIRLEHNVTVITVQHTRKNLSSGKNASQGGELAEEDGEGGRMLISVATINIGVERNKEAEDDVLKNTTFLSLFKNRPDQKTGRHIAKLFYRAKANRLYAYSDAAEMNFFSDDLNKEVHEINDDKSFSLSNITDNIDDYESVSISSDIAVELDW